MKKSSEILLFFCFVIFFLFNSSAAQTDKTKDKIQQFRFFYWNDNFLCEDLIDDFIPKGKDDYVTASFSFEYLMGQKNHYWIYNCEFNILTNKMGHYRADLLTVLLSKTKRSSLGKIKAGLGLVGRGNFGGGEIQNFYHALFGYPTIDLPYLSAVKMGYLANSEIQYNFINQNTYSLSGNLYFSFVTAAGPSKVFPSLTVSYFKYFHFQISFGYVNYYKTDQWLRPFFNRGFMWKLETTKAMQKSLGVGLWLTEGLYGINDEFHFGFSLFSGLNWESYSFFRL